MKDCRQFYIDGQWVSPAKTHETAVNGGAEGCFRNTGQSCNAPTRMLVPRSKIIEATEAARQAAESTKVGDPFKTEPESVRLQAKHSLKKCSHLVNHGD